MILYFPASRTMRNKFPCLSYPVYGIFYISPSRLIQWKWNYTEQKCKTCEWLWNHSNSKVWNIASEKDWSALKKPKKLWECCRWEFTKEQNLPENWGKGDPCYNRNRNYRFSKYYFKKKKKKESLWLKTVSWSHLPCLFHGPPFLKHWPTASAWSAGPVLPCPSPKLMSPASSSSSERGVLSISCTWLLWGWRCSLLE